MTSIIRILCFSVIFLLGVQGALGADQTHASRSNAGQPSVEAIVDNLSEEQARRLLIEKVGAESAAEARASADRNTVGALAGFIEAVRDKVSLIQARIAFLKAGQDANTNELQNFFTYIGNGEKSSNPMLAVWHMGAILGAAFLVELIFYGYTYTFRYRLVSTPSVDWRSKAIKLLLSTLIDLISIIIFIAAAILLFYLFLNQTDAQRVLVATYLSATVIVRIALLVSRFFLAPSTAALRFLPLEDGVARYLHRWVIAIATLSSFGFLTCGLIRLAGGSEASHIQALFVIGLIIVAMLMTMILQNKRKVMEHLITDLDPDCVRAKLATHWHHIAVLGILFLVVISTLNMIMGNYGGYLAFKTILMLPLYFLVDFILRQILNPLFGFVSHLEEDPTIGTSSSSSNREVSMDAPDPSATETASSDSLIKPIEFDRIKNFIYSGLRIALAALFLAWTLNLWGLELTLGQAVARAAFRILIVVLICYVGWEFLNAAIQRRLKLELPDEDEEQEEGGAGGSRIGTLLLLLRKFILVVIVVLASMIILSALGVNIGPLIAGAGVLGLAIGFGAQTLVKDIISGVFFLIDDAFRLGDYVEISGTKGTVEHISLRSLKLRHHRGMINTIPFGDIATITNYSRDYIITKLDFRVRYDTDVEKIRKIVKKQVYKVILKNEELAPKLLGKIKSQGVRQMEDSAMIMRIKYKTIPGEQFVIRKEVYRLLQEAFQEAGIEFAHRNVTVYLPPESSPTDQTVSMETGHSPIKTAAAATTAAALIPPDTKKVV